MSLPPDVYDLPSELSCKAQPLIGLTGLDTLNNAIHRSVWEAFSNNRRPDKTSVKYRLLAPDHEFPIAKAKRNSYEWYIPKGIMKRNWMEKYVNQIPAVVVIFYDLDWDDAFWNEKKLECASRVQSVRASLEGRSTRVAVVLVQHSPTLPTGDDTITAERAASLCSTCELNAKSLFLLPHSDHLQGYTLRLENAFYDLATSFYHQKVRSIRSHRDHLNKTTHQYLFVRHQFKIAFLNELKQDPTTSVKHYTQAYGHLLDVRMVDTNAVEIKTIAGFISYKLCQIAFALNMPRDAISQFRKHIEIFKPLSGAKELAFEHHAWLAKQYCIFGELFDEAIQLGLPAVQTQHPGIYFQQAAQHAVDRKQACLQLCKDVTVYPHPDPLDGAEDLEFFGQRPWRPGKLSAEPADVLKEKEGIQALQYQEAHSVNHSMLIIALLGSAISQAKTYKCPRTRRQLVVEMSEEYHSAKDYNKALTLLSHVLWEYRGERWSLLLTHVLLRALDCAYRAASVQDFVALGVEAQGPHVSLGPQHKSAIMAGVNAILKGNPPMAIESSSTKESGASGDETDMNAQWRAALSAPSLTKPLTVDMSNTTALLEVKARFCQPTFEADKKLQLEVLLRCCCEGGAQPIRVTVVVTSPSSSIELEAVAEQGPFVQVPLKQGEVKRYQCSFRAHPGDVGKELQISAVHLYLGSAPGVTLEQCLLLRYPGVSNDTATPCHELQHFRPFPRNMPDFDAAKPQSTITVVPRESMLKVKPQIEAPALVGEWFRIGVELHNEEASEMTGLSIEVSQHHPSGDQDHATHLCSKSSHLEAETLPLRIPAHNVKPGQHTVVEFFLKSLRLGLRTIALKACYKVDQGETSCLREATVQVEVVKPFEVTAKFLSLKFEIVTKAFAQEPFIAMPELCCLSPWPLYIEDTCLELAPQMLLVETDSVPLISQLKDTNLRKEEVGSEAFCINAISASDQPQPMGMYTVRWRRSDSALGVVTSSSITLPALLRVDPAPLFVELELPAHGWVGAPMAAWYRVHNRTSKLLEVDLALQASDAFMFAGHKQLRLRLLPSSVHTLSYNLYPLLSGLVALPQLRLTPTDGSSELRASQLVELLDRSLPTHIYVMPQAKGKPDARLTS